MSVTPVLASAPGKLVLAGDYAVLQPGEPSVVAAIDRQLQARVTPADSYGFSSESLGVNGLKADYRDGRWTVESGPAPRILFAAAAVNTVLAYLRAQGEAITPFHLSLEGGLESPDGAKYGFGSSAAVSVAIVGAILGAFGYVPENLHVFKLAVIAHQEAQGSGSGIDIAASAYGGVVRYVAFDRDWLRTRLSEETVASVMDAEWPLLGIEPLGWPASMQLGVGWTGQPASTAHLIRAVGEVSARRTSEYARFLITARQATNALAAALRDRSSSQAIQAVGLARTALRGLQEASGVEIETEPLRRLADLAEECGGAGKSSGAGGGDCGIAVFPDAEGLACARAAWKKSGIVVLEVGISRSGLELTRLEE